MARTADRTPRRAPRRRSLVESLGAIVLIFESVVMFLAALAIFGLKALPAEQALIGGALLVVTLFITAALLRWTWGVVLGSVLQVAVLLTGLFVPTMWLVGTIFTRLWAYAVYTGITLDKQKKEVTP